MTTMMVNEINLKRNLQDSRQAVLSSCGVKIYVNGIYMYLIQHFVIPSLHKVISETETYPLPSLCPHIHPQGLRTSEIACQRNPWST